MKQAIGRYSRDFVAILVLAAIGLATLFVILSQQASALPSWFPILGEDRFELEAEFHERTGGLSPLRRAAADVQEVRWALEELRVSVVAQNLGTARPVSVKRLRRLLDDLHV